MIGYLIPILYLCTDALAHLLLHMGQPHTGHLNIYIVWIFHWQTKVTDSFMKPVTFLLQELSTVETYWRGVEHWCPAEWSLLNKVAVHSIFFRSKTTKCSSLHLLSKTTKTTKSSSLHLLSKTSHLHDSVADSKVFVGHHKSSKLSIAGQRKHL